MSAERRPWTEAELAAAKERIHAGEDNFRGDYEHCIELQCEHTALCEALAGLERDCTRGMESGDWGNFGIDQWPELQAARAALSAAMPQKEGAR